MERWQGSEVLVEMREVRYGGQNGKTIQLEVDPDLVAVRARRGRSLREGPVPPPEAALLDEMETVLSFPQAGVEVYRHAQESSRSTEELRRELHESPATRFAGRVLVDEKSREPVLYTENLFVKFADDKNRDECLEVLREAGLTVKQELPYATNAFFVATPEGTGQRVFDIANELLGRNDVEYCQPELVRRLGERAIFAQQWHLKTTTIAGRWVNASANVEAAHTITEGEDVTIAIIDTGTDIDHDEFASEGKLVAPRDTTSHDADPRPSGRGENHGKGCVVFFAAGNGNESVDNDGYASYERVLAVAACNDQSLRSVYSDHGDAVFCAFPSNDFEFPEEDHQAPLTPGIWTTDRTGRSGYSDDDYTNSFGGTSSACPGAAGVAALVLSCNPSLSWDEVRYVLRRTCDQIDPEGGEYDEEGHSSHYGYGRLNAERAARSAGGQTRRVHGRRVHGRRVHGRRVHGRSTVSDDHLDLIDGASEGASKVLGLAGGISEQATRELLLVILLTAQAAQIEDLRERVAQLEVAGP